jgi:hypothetical protein
MTGDFPAVFASLKIVLAKHAQGLSVKTDTSSAYLLVGNCASPFPQRKGHFGSLLVGKAQTISPDLKKRMQGKTCFNFKTNPETSVGC